MTFWPLLADSMRKIFWAEVATELFTEGYGNTRKWPSKESREKGKAVVMKRLISF